MKLHNGTKISILDSFFDSHGLYNSDDEDDKAIRDYIIQAVIAYTGPVPVLSPETYYKESTE